MYLNENTVNRAMSALQSIYQAEEEGVQEFSNRIKRTVDMAYYGESEAVLLFIQHCLFT